MSEYLQAYYDKESNVKKIVKQRLQDLSYEFVSKGEYPLPIGEGGYRRYPDIYARKSKNEVTVVECKGGPRRNRFYHTINALGQVLAVKAHYPDSEIVIAVPESWGKDCLSKKIRERYGVKLWLVYTTAKKILDVDGGHIF